MIIIIIIIIITDYYYYYYLIFIKRTFYIHELQFSNFKWKREREFHFYFFALYKLRQAIINQQHNFLFQTQMCRGEWISKLLLFWQCLLPWKLKRFTPLSMSLTFPKQKLLHIVFLFSQNSTCWTKAWGITVRSTVTPSSVCILEKPTIPDKSSWKGCTT